MEQVRYLGQRYLLSSSPAERVSTSVDVELWGNKDIQGYICETTGGRSPSTILSEYIGYPVHLVVKGPRVRQCKPTLNFPELDAPSYFQDGYPLLLMSEESVGAVQERIRDMVGTKGINDKWAEEELKIERYVKTQVPGRVPDMLQIPA